MTPEQDRQHVDRIAKFVLGELDLDAAWFAAAWADTYRRMEALQDEAKTAGFLACSRCGAKLPAPLLIPEEGDRWECSSCWQIGEAQDRAEASGMALLQASQPTRGAAALAAAAGVLSQVYADYSHPNFTDRHGMAPKIRDTLAMLEDLLWPKGNAPKPATRL